MNKPLLVICGPTSTGKTALGIELAKKFNGEIISADSRQVYKDMTIGTGKEYSQIVTIWGYDLVTPEEEYSVSHFQSFAKTRIEDILSRQKLPILVGGTGLYINSIIGNINTTHIPQNEKLRKDLSFKNASELFSHLIQLNKAKADSLNESDRKNPRRLIRAIEIEKSGTKNIVYKQHYSPLIIGLKSNMKFLENRLQNSIQRRIEQGFENEVTSLFKNYPHLTAQSRTATGYEQMKRYIDGLLTESQMRSEWYLSERQYVKRQLTWFKKQENIHWFDIEAEYKQKVEQLVRTWHNSVCLEK